MSSGGGAGSIDAPLEGRGTVHAARVAARAASAGESTREDAAAVAALAAGAAIGSEREGGTASRYGTNGYDDGDRDRDNETGYAEDETTLGGVRSG